MRPARPYPMSRAYEPVWISGALRLRPQEKSVFVVDGELAVRSAYAIDGATVAGQPVHLTGFDALVEDSGGDSDGPGVLVEAVLGGVGALAVLAFVFASLLAFVPLGMAIVSTPRGLMTDREARTANLGGELVALVW